MNATLMMMANVGLVAINLVILGLSLKLYTEIVKYKQSENRNKKEGS